MKINPRFVTLILIMFPILKCFASVPNEVTLDGIAYFKADQNDMGNHKSAEYLQKGETLSNWTSKFAIHYYMNEKNPVEFAKGKSGDASNIVLIDDNKNNIIQTFDTIVPVNDVGGPYIFQQNVWRYEKLNFDKGIISIEYSTRKSVPSQTAPAALQGVDPKIQNDMKSMEIDRFEF
ncbi:MAG: hypothetical protein AB7I18_04635 [Candidatus Berkiella sp.]